MFFFWRSQLLFFKFLPQNTLLAGELQVSKQWPTVVFCDPRGTFGLDSVGV